MNKDVPSPIDLRNMDDAKEWESTAMEKRPCRVEFFDRFAEKLLSCTRVLELGSGPGFLAAHVLNTLADLHMSLLDFSPAMHELAKSRLSKHLDRVNFIANSFKDPDWNQGLAEFDAVITNQAVHELRHKDYAVELHTQVREILPPGKSYLVCDHFAGDEGMKNTELYMSIEEQVETLRSAGFDSVTEIYRKQSLVLHEAI